MDPLDDLGVPPPPGAEPPKPEDEPLELARPAGRPAPSAGSLPPVQRPPRPSNPGANRAVVSASRLQPVPEPKGRITGERLKEGAADVALNAVSSLKDVVEDFRRSDRFFKYKALVIGVWLALSVASLVIAWPSGGSSNSFGAKLVINRENNPPIYMVKNDSETAWENVEIIVNGQWHATSGNIGKQEGLVLSRDMLVNPEGKTAPGDLNITDIQLKVGDDETVLLKNGETR